MWHESIYVNLYFTISESLTGVRLKSKSGMKKPSNCPISSSRITPSANWTANPQSIGTLKVIREVITESIFIKRKPVSSRRFPAVGVYLFVHIYHLQTQRWYMLVDKVYQGLQQRNYKTVQFEMQLDNLGYLHQNRKH